jgi:UDP-N-acetylmuramoyl-tripeptide--D-alanyl-D-alanine ligase
MSGVTLGQAATWIGAHHCGGDAGFTTVCADTRQLRGGELFVALHGERCDGHEFLAQARGLGAVGALVARETRLDWPQLVVDDTRAALGRLAAGWRRAFGHTLIAITGSNGKTTVKEMLRLILGEQGPVLATRGNLNNDIGVPLTLLRLQGEPYAVVEMGANHPGEIGYLSRIARPDLVLLNNVGAAHLAGFGDLGGVARAKGESIEGLAPDGLVVVNADDPWAPLWRGLAGARRVIGFAMDRPAEVGLVAGSVTTRWLPRGFRSGFVLDSWQGRIPVELALGGRHNVMNALAAAAAALGVGATLTEVSRGLAQLEPVPGRLQTRLTPSGAQIIDDTYNANPDSVAAAITLLGDAPGERWMVLGDLAELGAGSADLHAAIGQRARAAGIDRLFSVGLLSAAASAAFGTGARHFASQPALLEELHPGLGADTYVLVKGSRSSAMEHVVQALVQGATC